VKIQFKLRAGAAPDVDGAVRLFPDDDDPELASLYVVELPDDEAEETLAKLKRSSSVEFAEPQAERGLRE
jgi:fervidolysin-like protein